jgi:hypothetical protein
MRQYSWLGFVLQVRRLPDDVNVILNVYLKIEEDIEAAVKFFNDTVQWAGWNATPEHSDTLKTYGCPILTKQKIEEN